MSSNFWIGAATNQIYLTTGGKVGINDSAPGESLSINGNTYSNGDVIFKNAASIAYTGKSNQIFLNNNGQVGIGMGTTTQALTVSGNIQMNSGNWIGSTTGNRMLFTSA